MAEWLDNALVVVSADEKGASTVGLLEFSTAEQ
jgi:hypothetical protein